MGGSSQDGCQALVAPFQALSSNTHRRRALKALVKALTHHQIRELRLSLEEVDLHCDIIADLPLEISQIIVQHLPLYQVFQARRVSSKWRQVLSAPQTVEPLLRSHFPTPNAETALHIPEGLSADSIISLKAEHIDACRTGHPFSYARHEWDCCPEEYWSWHNLAYADGFMAWLDTTDGHIVRSLDLKTGQRWSFIPEARTRINAVRISSSIVAALGSGRCDVWILETGDHYSLRLPSAASSDILTISGETLAFAHIPGWPEAGSRAAEVLTWTLRNQRTSSFSVALLSEYAGFDINLMLDKKGQSLLSFEEFPNHFPEVRPTQFRWNRTSLDGIVLSQGVIEVPDTRDSRNCSHDMEHDIKESNGQAVIWSWAEHHHGTDDISTLMLVCYNFQEDRLEFLKRTVTGFRLNHQDPRYGLKFHWKDAAYFLKSENDHLNLMVIDLQQSTCSKAKMDFPADGPLLMTRNGPIDFRFSDETFLVCVYRQGFCVWCFDANVRLFNENVAYKEQRKSNRDSRLLLKRDEEKSSSDDSVTRKLD